MPQPGAITYDGLPVSSGGGHTLRTKGPAAGFHALQSFVDSISLETVPTQLWVELLEGDAVSAEYFSTLSNSFTAEFGNQVKERTLGDWTGHIWNLGPRDLQGIIQELENVRPIPMTPYAGPAVVITVFWNLVLFEVKTRGRLPHQFLGEYADFKIDPARALGESFIAGRISEKTTCNLFLSLPYVEATDEARQIAQEIQKRFPVRLSPKHWKAWKLTKSGKSYVSRKIAGLI